MFPLNRSKRVLPIFWKKEKRKKIYFQILCLVIALWLFSARFLHIFSKVSANCQTNINFWCPSDFLKMKTLLRLQPILSICLKWTPKNIPDRQKCVGFQKSKKVLNHSILLCVFARAPNQIYRALSIYLTMRVARRVRDPEQVINY